MTPFTAGYWAWLDRHEQRMVRAVQGPRRLADLDDVRAQERDRELF